MGNNNSNTDHLYASEINGLKREWFKGLQENMKKTCDNTKESKFNTSISFNKTDFINSGRQTRMRPDQNEKWINWKEYLLNYIQKEADNGIEWLIPLYYQIAKEEFHNEYIWLSQFFYQEYKLFTQPLCLNNIQKDNEEELIHHGIYATNLNGNFKNNLMGSFVSNASENLPINDPSYEYHYYKQSIKMYMDIFQQHIFNPSHPINIITTFYIKEFTLVIIDTIKLVKKENDQKEKEHLLKGIIIQLQKFIVEMEVVVKLFYSKTISYQFFIEEKDEFGNLVTSLLFKNGRLYDNMYMLYETVYHEQLDELSHKMSMIKNITPVELGINKQFCLDGISGKYKSDLKWSFNINNENRYNEDNRDGNISIELEKSTEGMIFIDNGKKSSLNKGKKKPRNTYRENQILMIKDDYQINKDNIDIKVLSESQKLAQFTASHKDDTDTHQMYHDDYPPYQYAIKQMKSLNSYNAPFEKMMAIATISAEITENVNKYWKDMEMTLPPGLLKIDADQLMSIYIYIIIKSQLCDIIIHSAFIRDFTCKITKSTMMGYYFTTLDGCLSYILDIKDTNDFYKTKKTNDDNVNEKNDDHDVESIN